MSSVYAGHHRTIGSEVAIKILDEDWPPEAEMTQRFLQEARVAARVRHTNVVSVHDFGHAPWGAPFMVMELLEGLDLQQMLEQHGRLPWTEAVAVLRQVLHGLVAIHAQGVVHRDIKPQNCFVARHEGEMILKLIDFGIAQPPEDCRSCRTAAKLILGTPNYLAPEQARGKYLDGRTDLYAAGVMFFELLSGRLPFVGESPADVISMHLRQPVPSLFDVAPDLRVPKALDQFILKAMAKHPSRRFANAREMLAGLEDAVHENLHGDFRVQRGSNGLPTRARKGDGAPARRGQPAAPLDSPLAWPTRTAADLPTAHRGGGARHRVSRLVMIAAAASLTFFGIGRAAEAIASLSTGNLIGMSSYSDGLVAGQSNRHHALLPALRSAN